MASSHEEPQARRDGGGAAAQGPAGAALPAADEYAVHQTLQVACQGELSASALAQQLSSRSAFTGAGFANPIATFSAKLVNSLPRIHRRNLSGGETVSGELKAKLDSHNILLHSLSDANCLLQLQPSTLRCIFEHSQKVSALAELRDLETQLKALHNGFSPLGEVINKAGDACINQVHGGGDRPAWEVFYASPSIAVLAFLHEICATATAIHVDGGTATDALQTILQLANALQIFLSGAHSLRGYQQQWFGAAFNVAVAEFAEPEWTAAESARIALQSLVDAIVRITPALTQEAPAAVDDAATTMFALADHLLNSYAAALGSVGAGQKSGLQSQYAAAKDCVLDFLLQYATSVANNDAHASMDALQHVESLAEAHYGYSQLLDICDFLGDKQRLYAHMRNLSGDMHSGVGSMITFVFTRLLASDRKSELLELADDFDTALYEWLRIPSEADDLFQRLQLRWLHDLRLGDYGAAAKSLDDLCSSNAVLDLEATRRLLSIEKLAAMAVEPNWPLGGPEQELSALLATVEKRLALLDVQVELGQHDNGLIAAEALVTEALNSSRPPADALLALRGFAAMGDTSNFQQAHRALWKATWARLIEASNWEDIAEHRDDDDFCDLLHSQPLCQAISLLYGSQASSLAYIPPASSVFQALDAFTAAWSDAARNAVASAFQAGSA